MAHNPAELTVAVETNPAQQRPNPRTPHPRLLLFLSFSVVFFSPLAHYVPRADRRGRQMVGRAFRGCDWVWGIRGQGHCGALIGPRHYGDEGVGGSEALKNANPSVPEAALWQE